METPPTRIPEKDLQRLNESTDAVIASNDELLEAMHAVVASPTFKTFVAACTRNKKISQEAITIRSEIALAHVFTLDDDFNTRTGRISRKQQTEVDENVAAMGTLWQLVKGTLGNV